MELEEDVLRKLFEEDRTPLTPINTRKICTTACDHQAAAKRLYLR